MLKVGDRVKYREVTGVIKSIMDEMAIVTMQDGKDYAMPYGELRLETGERVVAPETFGGVMEALRPNLKNVNFLNEFAKEMSKAGVSELIIRNGAIQNFAAKESLDEKKARLRAEAIKAAEEQAMKEFEAENKV